ncbi:MAG TPA: hypothetical protein PK069_08750, partial [Methanolinea sp.]|nr:hypothetical protein [Methanolinea sp.]HQK56553.1 hypothetical protein [Methanolinea sp.]
MLWGGLPPLDPAATSGPLSLFPRLPELPGTVLKNRMDSTGFEPVFSRGLPPLDPAATSGPLSLFP